MSEVRFVESADYKGAAQMSFLVIKFFRHPDCSHHYTNIYMCYTCAETCTCVKNSSVHFDACVLLK